ncbi:MAG: hypothetical protein ACK5S1_00830, partial [bacterium]
MVVTNSRWRARIAAAICLAHSSTGIAPRSSRPLTPAGWPCAFGPRRRISVATIPGQTASTAMPR